MSIPVLTEYLLTSNFAYFKQSSFIFIIIIIALLVVLDPKPEMCVGHKYVGLITLN